MSTLPANLPGLPSIVRHLMRTLGRGEATAELAIGLAVHATQAGHVCADLDLEAGWGPWAPSLDAAQRAAFRSGLARSEPVGSGDADWTPLVWDGRRLSLRRYWAYERALAADLLMRARSRTAIDPRIDAALNSQFADAGQRQAARMALASHLALITGGPGTGKTTTLARLIGLLREQAVLSGAAQPRIALAAPTGKAAARMAESLEAAGVELPAAGAMTLHRLLGMQGNGRRFRFNRDQPLPVDVLVVDEASMIDLSLMAHLVDALPARARLILLGDRDQLAAVEAGAVFADLCASPQLADCVAALTTSFRFGSQSGIGRFAEALRNGDAAAAITVLKSGNEAVAWQPQVDLAGVIGAAREAYAPYLAAVAAGRPAMELFGCFNRFRVLCALRTDVERVNQALALRPVPQWFASLPLIITRNDALLQLYNGDVGLVLPDPADGQLKACFPGRALGEEPRWITPLRLSNWEPAWAMTVHKSQGSEFERVLLALPGVPSAVATRELVYTAVTRARQGVSLWASEGVLADAIARRAERMSGLQEQISELCEAPADC